MRIYLHLKYYSFVLRSQAEFLYLCTGVGPREADESYKAFFEGKKAVIEGVYGKSEATLYSWLYLAYYSSMS
jgi:hypothetical protein